MLKCLIDKKEDRISMEVEGTQTQIYEELSKEMEILLEQGIIIEVLIAALVHATNTNLNPMLYDKCCDALRDLLHAIRKD